MQKVGRFKTVRSRRRLSSTPKNVRLKQCVSCSDIQKRCQYIEECVKQKAPVDVRQIYNLLKLTEMYNSAVLQNSTKQKKSKQMQVKA